MDDGGSPNTGFFKKIFHKLPFKDSEDVTEEEIISMVNEGHEQGVLRASEAEMIHNIFEFSNLLRLSNGSKLFPRREMAGIFLKFVCTILDYVQ